MKRKIEYPCCFCGEIGSDKGLALVEMEHGTFEQQWWCHVACLLDRMVEPAKSAYSAELT